MKFGSFPTWGKKLGLIDSNLIFGFIEWMVSGQIFGFTGHFLEFTGHIKHFTGHFLFFIRYFF